MLLQPDLWAFQAVLWRNFMHISVHFDISALYVVFYVCTHILTVFLTDMFLFLKTSVLERCEKSKSKLFVV